MGSLDKTYAVAAAAHGVDILGLSQPTGGIFGIASAAAKTGRSDWFNKLLISVNDSSYLKKGMAIQISGLGTGHSGLTRVLAIPGPSHAIVNLSYATAYTATQGTWDLRGGAGAWDAFQPIGVDLPVKNISTLTFWNDNVQPKGATAPTSTSYTKDVIYRFPGGIKTIALGTAGSTGGDIRLFRSATLRPEGRTAQ